MRFDILLVSYLSLSKDIKCTLDDSIIIVIVYCMKVMKYDMLLNPLYVLYKQIGTVVLIHEVRNFIS